MHVIAKIAAWLLWVYLIVSFAHYVLNMMVGFCAFLFQAEWSITFAMMGSLAVYLCLIWLAFRYLICRSDKLASKIVGSEELSDVGCAFNWYPFALRLTMMIAGFLFLQKTISLSGNLVYYIRYSFHSDTLAGIDQVYEYGAYFLSYLAASIYLLCGAPHFVRWQIKKTIELCREFSER
jgi:hypothetical protein